VSISIDQSPSPDSRRPGACAATEVSGARCIGCVRVTGRERSPALCAGDLGRSTRRSADIVGLEV
jgi:hypothetical protein